MKKKVFISGPILGMETNQGYRETITELCEKLGFEVIDPWRREKSLYKGDELWWWPKLSAGACMELFYAKRKGKKIIVVSEMESLSPWIEIHSDGIVKNFNELEDTLKKK
jgi:hypothetical protein